MTAPQPDSSDDERKESKKKLLHQKCKDECVHSFFPQCFFVTI
jgi:hypothetical protein